jgi:SET and MYND domain-containing protein 4
MESLNTIAAIKHREEGDHNLLNRDYYEALLCYNRSLIFAEADRSYDLLSLAFANRSAVYIEIKEFEMCLENILLAKEHGYPSDKLPMLIEREEKCNKLMKEAKTPDPDEDPRKFFKLSYPANPKIPFIIDGLEMREDEKFGRGIYATRDLKAGDIIAIEEPFYLEMPSPALLCAKCYEGNSLSLIPNNEECKFVRYFERLVKFNRFLTNSSDVLL